MERVKILANAGSTSQRHISIEKWVDSIILEGDPDCAASSDGAMTYNEDDLLLGAEAKIMTAGNPADDETRNISDKISKSVEISQLAPVKQNFPSDEIRPVTMEQMTNPAHDQVMADLRDHVTSDDEDHVTEKMAADSELETSCERELSWRTKLAVMGLIHMDSIQSQSEINNKTYTCVDDILQDRSEDPEEILTNLGFAGQPEMASPLFRVPVRFLKEPTRASGIDVKTFLENNPDFQEYLTTKGVVLDKQCKTGNVCEHPSPMHSHVDKFTNLGQLAAYCMASEVPNRFLLSLSKMFPRLPLFAAAAETQSEFGCVSDADLTHDEQLSSSRDQLVEPGDPMGDVGMTRVVGVSECVASGSPEVVASAAAGHDVSCLIEKAGLTGCDLGGCETGDTKNAHMMAACQAEASIMELCVRTTRQNSSGNQAHASTAHIASPGFESLLNHVTNANKDTAPRYISIASDSPPTSDDRFCQCDCAEEQWDYSDVVGFQCDGRPRKSFSMPKLELYHSDEFYSNSNKFPRSETIDFFIYDYDHDKTQLLLDNEVAAFDKRPNDSEKVTVKETLL